MGTRLQLHNLLINILGSKYVYFQPPENIKIVYPCIIYEKDFIDNKYANDLPYKQKKRYKVTLIDQNPDSIYLDKLINIQGFSFDRHYVSNNLNHDVYTVYY